MGPNRIPAAVAASLASALLILALAYAEARASATVSLTSPSGGQSYAVGAPISFSGSGSWDVGKDSRTRDIDIDLLWIDPADPDDIGTIVTSASPAIDFKLDESGAYTGSYTFANATTLDGESTLHAARYEAGGIPQPSPYSLRAMPTKVGSTPYSDGTGDHVVDVKKLGSIAP